MTPLVTTLLVLFGVLILAGAVFALKMLPNKGARGQLAKTYQRCEKLFSAAEHKFLVELEGAVAPQCRVFGKVRVTDVVEPRAGMTGKARTIALNKVSQKHFDFVVCRADTLAVLCAVELNDSSHQSRKAKQRDEFLGSVCEAVGLPLLTVRAAATYSKEALRQQVVDVLRPAQPAPAPSVQKPQAPRQSQPLKRPQAKVA